MSTAIGDQQEALASTVRDFAHRVTPIAWTRQNSAGLMQGDYAAFWDRLVATGVPSVHLPDEFGGGGGGLADLVAALDAAGETLLPGPLPATVAASAAVCAFGSPELRARWLPTFANGATGACAVESGSVALSAAGQDFIADGTSGPVLGVLSAQVLILAGRSGDGSPVWFAVPADEAGVTRRAEESVDLTRDVGYVSLAELRVPRAAILAARDDDVSALAALPYCAEAVGAARRALFLAVEYARVREQFGRPIGSFQAIKHKCADLRIRVELLTAAVWDAALAFDGGDRDQFGLAMSRAATLCAADCTEIVLDPLTVFGAIGNTWEHDIHLFWRRTVSLSALIGPEDWWSRSAGERALVTRRDPDLGVADRPEFRARIAATLAEASRRGEPEAQRALADAGLVAPYLPQPYGIGADAVDQAIIAEERAKAGMPLPQGMVGEWVVSAVLQHGTDHRVDQLTRFAAASLRGDLLWCQLFSEPEAGSDLRSLRTRAVRAEGGWIITGTKIWTTGAHQAHRGICLARIETSCDASRRRIGCFLVDMSSTGIEVQPIRQANGEWEFNEVRLDAVFVPDHDVLGSPDDGWRIAATTLTAERVSIGGTSVSYGTRYDPVEVVSRLDETRKHDAIPRLGRLDATTGAIDALARRGIRKRAAGARADSESSLLKVASAQHVARVARQVLGWFGPEASYGSLGADTQGGGRAARAYLSTPAVLIGGGTREIQLNIIAERILGLPRN